MSSSPPPPRPSLVPLFFFLLLFPFIIPAVLFIRTSTSPSSTFTTTITRGVVNVNVKVYGTTVVDAFAFTQPPTTTVRRTRTTRTTRTTNNDANYAPVSSTHDDIHDAHDTDTLVDRLLDEIQQQQQQQQHVSLTDEEEEEDGESLTKDTMIQSPSSSSSSSSSDNDNEDVDVDVVIPPPPPPPLSPELTNHTMIIEDLISTLSKIQQQQQQQEEDIVETPSSSSSNNINRKFEPLIGYYNVTYTLTQDPNENPVGGKWTRRRRRRRRRDGRRPVRRPEGGRRNNNVQDTAVVVSSSSNNNDSTKTTKKNKNKIFRKFRSHFSLLLPRPRPQLPSLWTVQRTLQHILPPPPPSPTMDADGDADDDDVDTSSLSGTGVKSGKVNSSSSSSVVVVAQVVNAILLECFGGWFKIWVVLRGDAVPIKSSSPPEEEKEQIEVKNVENQNDITNNNKKNNKKRNVPNKGKKKKKLIPGLTDRTVEVFFDKPKIGIQINKNHKKKTERRNTNHRNKSNDDDDDDNYHFRQVVSLGPKSSVVIDTPYVDSKIRVGIGGTSGTKFVFRRIPIPPIPEQEDGESEGETKIEVEQTSNKVISDASSFSSSNEVYYDYDAIDGWKWVLENSQEQKPRSSGVVLTKKKMMTRVGVLHIISALCFKLIRDVLVTSTTSNPTITTTSTMLTLFRTVCLRPMKWIAGVSTIISFWSFVWLLFSTGGIEER